VIAMSGALDSDRVLVTALAKSEDEGALLDASFNRVDRNVARLTRRLPSCPAVRRRGSPDALGATKWSQSVSHHAV